MSPLERLALGRQADDLVLVRLARLGDDWQGSARRGGRELAWASASSPGEVLEDLALELDAEETERIKADVARRSEAEDEPDPSDLEAWRERAWREETGSNDPQGPPVGWRPGRRRRRP